MVKKRSKRKPGFFWQGLLILLPVAVLATVGFFSLRQDRRLADQDAKKEAGEIALRLTLQISNALANLPLPEKWDDSPTLSLFNRPACVVDSSGRLRFPLPITEAVPQPLDLTKLDPEQKRLWQEARDAEFQNQAADGVVEKYRRFISKLNTAENHRTERFLYEAFYSIGLLQQKQQKHKEAADAFEQVSQAALTESGLWLHQLAAVRQRFATASFSKSWNEKRAALDQSCREVFVASSPVAPYVFELAKQLESGVEKSGSQKLIGEMWELRWMVAKESRGLWEAVRKAQASLGLSSDDLVAARPFWLEDFWGPGLILFQPMPGDLYWLVTMPREKLLESLEKILRAEKIPSYFGVGVEVAGKNVVESKEQGEILVGEKRAGIHRGFIEVTVSLIDPATFYVRQRQRTFWFGLLIGVASLAALVGFGTAYRAFVRQCQLNELKGNFVSSVSHELRAPIASVRLMAEGLERGKISAPLKQKEYFRFIVQECRRLSALIENVLDFSRIEQGRKEYEFEPTDIAKLVVDTVKIIEPYAMEKNVYLTLAMRSVAGDPADITPPIDGRAMQQALMNLIDNAFKHSPNGATVKIGLDFLRDKLPGAEMRRSDETPLRAERERVTHFQLWVEDQGPGIPIGEQEKIFERFYRLGSELRRETQGVGIGLSIVKHIVEAHRGRVIIHSVVGKGSRFTLEIPVRDRNHE